MESGTPEVSVDSQSNWKSGGILIPQRHYDFCTLDCFREFALRTVLRPGSYTLPSQGGPG